MIYKRFGDIELSALGFGTMRLPVRNGVDGDIDEAEAERLIDYAMAHGVNYYDTAWGYHDGNSELVVGKILQKYPRDKFYLASKFPGYDLGNIDKVEEIFERQLQKCRVSYFDFYLFHNVCEMNIDAYLDESHGIFAYLSEQKKRGRIKHLGFSVHGSADVLMRFLDKYGEHMEFGQVQLNYLDWEFQNAKQKVEMLASRGIPVWVMEPLRGGRLARLDEADAARLKSLRPNECIPAWAFRFLQTLPPVTVILSGMSSMAQVEDNIATFAEEKPLDKPEMSALFEIAAGMTAKTKLPCTACKYCVSHCPKGLNIPELVKLYNEHKFTGGGFLAPMALSTYGEDKLPGACIGCRSCEKVCPQGIKISRMMSEFSALLEEK